MKELQSIKFWIFDLDNTLYSGKTKVFEQVDKKMSKYISEKLNVSIGEAKKIGCASVRHVRPYVYTYVRSKNARFWDPENHVFATIYIYKFL